MNKNIRDIKRCIDQAVSADHNVALEPPIDLQQAMWRADVFARRVLGEHGAAAVYAQAYPGRPVPDWIQSRHLRRRWVGGGHLPAQWTIAAIQDLFAELETFELRRFATELKGLAYRRAVILAEASIDTSVSL